MFSKYEVYYRITYPERTLSYVNIESFVYIGKNISGKDKENIWYFEFLKSFIESDGVNNTNYEGRYFSCVTEKDKGDMLNTDEMYRTLKNLDEKRALNLKQLIKNGDEKVSLKWVHATEPSED